MRAASVTSLLLACVVSISSAACAPSIVAAPPASASITVKTPTEISASDESRRSFETARLYAAYKCAGAEAKLQGKATAKATASSGALGTAGIVIGVLGVVGGITTAVLASQIKPQLPDAPTGSVNPDDVDVKGKSAVVGIGIGTAVAVAGAVVITLIVASKSGGDDDSKKQTDALVGEIDSFKKDCADPSGDRLALCAKTADKLAADCEARLK
jgi:hypothetical protein